jgi:hypothetical protein
LRKYVVFFAAAILFGLTPSASIIQPSFGALPRSYVLWEIARTVPHALSGWVSAPRGSRLRGRRCFAEFLYQLVFLYFCHLVFDVTNFFSAGSDDLGDSLTRTIFVRQAAIRHDAYSHLSAKPPGTYSPRGMVCVPNDISRDVIGTYRLAFQTLYTTDVGFLRGGRIFHTA